MIDGWVVICISEDGDARAYGPFETDEEADEWLADQSCRDPDQHYIATLDPPD